MTNFLSYTFILLYMHTFLNEILEKFLENMLEEKCKVWNGNILNRTGISILFFFGKIWAMKGYNAQWSEGEANPIQKSYFFVDIFHL